MRCPEHPRVRGENDGLGVIPSPSSGTSPRTRGKHWGRNHRRYCGGNIPAYAGKTFRHPQRLVQHTGTSPRTRGKQEVGSKDRFPVRNIPAYAGKTLIDVRFLVPDGHFTFGFVFLHRGGSMESPCSFLLSECFSDRIVVYGQLGTSLLSVFDCAFWWDGG